MVRKTSTRINSHQRARGLLFADYKTEIRISFSKYSECACALNWMPVDWKGEAFGSFSAFLEFLNLKKPKIMKCRCLLFEFLSL